MATLTASRYELELPTTLDPDSLRALLRHWEPWRYRIRFSNGVCTDEFARREPFVSELVSKWHYIAPHVPESRLRQARVLDIGCAGGHYGFWLAAHYGVDYVGIDNNSHQIALANLLKLLTGMKQLRFIEGDASAFEDTRQFDVILSLASLNNVAHPLLSLERATRMLAPGGVFVVEALVEETYGPEACAWTYTPRGYMGDGSLRWIPTRAALEASLASCGLRVTHTALEWRRADAIGEGKAKLMLLATR